MVKYRAFNTGSTYRLPSKILYRTSYTFYNTTTWVVPANVTRVRVDCVGAQGYCNAATGWQGGKGGRVECILQTQPGQTLYLNIFEYSRYESDASTIPYAPAYRTARYNASDIRTSKDDLWSRLVVAGGGGSMPNASEDAPTQAGAGGGLTGGTGYFARGQCTGGTTNYSDTTNYGSGGTWTAHSHSTGVARSGGFNGTFGLGGNGGGSAYKGEGGGGWTGNIAAGAGGAGWYGGAGGQASEYYGRVWGTPGGGGSSYTHPTLCSQVPNVNIHTQGFKTGSGYITLSILNGDPGYIIQEKVYLAHTSS